MIVRRKTLGLLLVLLGLALPLVVLPWETEYAQGRGIKRNLRFMEVTFYDKVEATYMDVAAFREEYPAYDDVEEGELARLIHQKYFADIPLETYREAFLSVKADSGGPGGGDPLGVRGSPFEASELDAMARAVMGVEAQELGLYRLTRRNLTVSYRTILMVSGALLGTGLVLFLLPRRRGM